MAKREIRAAIDVSTYSAVNDTLAGFKADLDELARGIGADEETANVFIEYESDPYDGGGSLTAYVWRWETDTEEAEREAREAEEAESRRQRDVASREAQERRTYEALKRKFG